MRRVRLVWRLYPSYLLVMLISLGAIAWHMSRSLERLYLERLDTSLRAQARLAMEPVAALLAQARLDDLEALCRRMGQASGSRFTVIKPGGVVAADSYEDPTQMENHGQREEVLAALEGKPGAATRFSHTTRFGMRYVALPIGGAEGRVEGVLRVSMPLSEVAEALRSAYSRIALGGGVAALAAAVAGWVVSRRLTRPLRDMEQAARRFARGDMTRPAPAADTEELASLAEALNTMARQVDERIREIERRQAEMSAILGSMAEGVLAVDMDQRILSVNGAGAALLGVDAARVIGRPLAEAIRNADLQRVVEAALKSGAPAQAELTLFDTRERNIDAHGALLRDGQGRSLGAVVVLNDVTSLRRLEKVRKDFVANVSHELRTPVTAIKGFAETLLGGAAADEAARERFLKIIARQAERLMAIISDLLALSRVEQDAARLEAEMAPGPVKDVLAAAVELCQVAAAARRVRVKVACPDDLAARMNPALMEQAVVNLVDNAVKYSPPDSEVEVEAGREAGGVVIRVKDHGCGIPPEHQPRIFERFYRVDKARSCEMGGTGLGLAIVKHIMLAHGGGVSVESAPGQGSVFTLRLRNGGTR